MDQLKIFAAAGKLKIEGLKKITAKKLMATVNHKNAFEVLFVSHTFEHNELKAKAFAEIKKAYPEIDSELANEPEKLLKVMEASKLLEEEIGKLKLK